jgi:ferredoxin-type protein NapH
MRQKTRRILVYISLLIFPLTLNYMSPYVSLDGAFQGIIAGSVLLFGLQFLSGIFFGRLWCGWLCPISGLSELGATVNSKNVPVKRLRLIRYSIFTIWFAILFTGFVLAGGIRGIDPFHLTEHIVSVDEPVKYFIYFIVLTTFFILTLTIGKRGACHTICWMAPFMAAGYQLGRTLRVPQLRVQGEYELCIRCGQCNRKCPMSIDVREQVKQGGVIFSDCILCCECIDTCPKKALSLGWKRIG